MFEKIKNLLKKETFTCIVWDGKVIKYWDLTQKKIDDSNTIEETTISTTATPGMEAVIDTDDASAYKLAENINIRLFDAYLKFYMHIPKPQKLSDEEWAEEIQNLHFIRKTEKETSESTL